MSMDLNVVPADPICESFSPIGSRTPLTLILGSMPSMGSLQRGEYYGHPRNRFWPMLLRLDSGSEGGRYLSYTAKIELLEHYRITLWDVASRCVRKGSLDKDMRDIEFNDIGSLLDHYVTIERIVCNGCKAYQLLSKLRAQDRNFDRMIRVRMIAVYRLHSTSPIPTAKCKSFDDLYTLWEPVLQMLQSDTEVLEDQR